MGGANADSGGADVASRCRALLDGGTLSVTVHDFVWVVIGMQVLLLIVVTLERAGTGVPLLRPGIAILSLTFLPGLLCLLLIGVGNLAVPRMLIYAAGLSFVIDMMVGVGMSLFYPIAGINRPISELPVVLTIIALVVLLAGIVTSKLDEDDVVLTLSLPQRAWMLVFLSLPFAGIIAITSVDRLETSAGAILFLIVLSLVPLIALNDRVDRGAYPLAVWGGALGLLYYKSLWSGSYPIEMWMHQMVLEQGRWMPVVGGDFAALPNIRGMGQEGVLTDAVLYPIYSLVTGVEMMTQLEVINPLFVSLVPLGMYETFRSYVPERDAVLGAFVFVFTFRFYSQHYPNAPRDVMATLFVVLLALLIADSHLNRRTRRILMVMFVAGMAVSHYGTSYLFVSAFVLAYPSLILLKIIKTEYRIGYRSSKIGNPDPKENIKTLRKHVDRISIEGINFLLLAFLIIFVVAWYLNTAGGIKFQLLVETIGSIGSLTQTSGLAEERVFSAQPFSIEVTRAMIVLFFVLIGVGFVTEVVRKLLIGSSEISDEHLTLAAGVVGVFALTFTGIGTGFGQGRVLMFSLSLSSLFAVRGLHNLRHISEFLSPRVDPLKRIREATAEHVTEDRVRTSFAGVLCVFLLLNTGVVAETITQGQDYGATIIVNNERLSQNDDPRLRIESQGCIQCDVQVHLWTVRYGDGRSQVYHGGFFRSHYWYGHSVAAGLDDFVTDYLLTNRSTLYREPLPAESTGIPDSSYLVLTHDNHDSGLIVTEEEDVVSIESVRPSLERSNRVYTSGHSTVYRSRNTTASVET